MRASWADPDRSVFSLVQLRLLGLRGPLPFSSAFSSHCPGTAGIVSRYRPGQRIPRRDRPWSGASRDDGQALGINRLASLPVSGPTSSTPTGRSRCCISWPPRPPLCGHRPASGRTPGKLSFFPSSSSRGRPWEFRVPSLRARRGLLVWAVSIPCRFDPCHRGSGPAVINSGADPGSHPSGDDDGLLLVPGASLIGCGLSRRLSSRTSRRITMMGTTTGPAPDSSRGIRRPRRLGRQALSSRQAALAGAL